MTRPTIPASIIAQRGKTVTFIDGSKATLVCTFGAIVRIEEDFGSVLGALNTIRQGMTGPAFTGVAKIMAACLQDEKPRDDVQLDDAEQLRDLLDPMLFDDYAGAAGDAISAAFPDEKAEAGEGDADPQKGSRGESGGISPV